MKYCQKCGKELTDEAMFCSGCGNSLSAQGSKKEGKLLGEFFTVKRVLNILKTLFLIEIFSRLSNKLVEGHILNNGWHNLSFFSILDYKLYYKDELLWLGIAFLILFGISLVLGILLVFSNLKLKYASVFSLIGTAVFYIIFISRLPQGLGKQMERAGVFTPATIFFEVYLILFLLIGAIILDIVAKKIDRISENKELQK